MSTKLQYKKCHHDARAPFKETNENAGFDLFSLKDYIIPKGETIRISTGIAIVLPIGTYGRVASRSSLALKSINVTAGVIDPGYTGVIEIIIHNSSNNNYEVKRHDKIAQLICEKIEFPELEEIDSLPETQRGSKGFGSTGR